MLDGQEDTDLTVETHSLLLSLAGLLDDELLGWCRELVAVGEGDYALELITGTVQADRLRLPEGAHDALLGIVRRRQLLGRSDTLPPSDSAPRMRHRFVADPVSAGFPPVGEHDSPELALQTVPARLLRDCQLFMTWRITPAGGSPGPVPHPVVLIETLELDGADVLAYQVGEVLSRAGQFASVEVFAAGMELSDYHRAALDAAHRIEFTGPDGASSGGAPATRFSEVNRPEPPAAGPLPGDVNRRAPAAGQNATRDDGRRAPLHPVDRVIAARGSAQTRRPHPENPNGTLDSSGLNFDRGTAGGRRTDQPIGSDDAATRALPSTGSGSGGPPPEGDDLSDVEQRLLRQLHEELAAREDDHPADDATRAFRSNGGRKRPRPNTGPDQAS